ncbi:hypothetical protein T4B_2088 [Trichinella pseudospiralis]|uniref:Uncharacterized protein n=1 Tax=Trichinella pseudospiralis TaxID=6337 RepID=A0A0V1IW95_TRIPS|nr:hypothetical protein T4B_2088 [Trichinella pseudospiralis]
MRIEYATMTIHDEIESSLKQHLECLNSGASLDQFDSKSLLLIVQVTMQTVLSEQQSELANQDEFELRYDNRWVKCYLSLWPMVSSKQPVSKEKAKFEWTKEEHPYNQEISVCFAISIF